MLQLMPILAFMSLWRLLARRWPAPDWRGNLLRAALVWGALAIVMTEALSLASLVRPWALALVWLVVAIGGWAAAGRWRSVDWRLWRRFESGAWGWEDWALLGAAAVIVAATALVAYASPPQTWDTLNYHMARVAHWAQMAAIRPYATGVEIQNSMPPGAEMLYLQSYVLAGGDGWVNFVDWSATLVTAVGVSLVAARLGAGRRGQLMACLFMLTLPMAIVQAGSTMTDIILALWVLGAAAELVDLPAGERESTGPLAWVGLAAGLAIVTKPTAFAYLAPLSLWTLAILLKSPGWGQRFKLAGLGIGLILIVNLGYFTREARLYGNPIAPSNRIQEHSNPWLGGRAFISNVLRNVAYQLATPSPYINKAVALAVIEAHQVLGLETSDPRTTAAGQFKVALPTTSEDLAQNPVHMVLLLIISGTLIVRWRQTPRRVAVYAFVPAASLLAFSLLFQWQVFGSRYLLPFFCLSAPLAGLIMGSMRRWHSGMLVSGLLVAACLPWLFGVRTRPLLARQTDGQWVSVLAEPRTQLMFANGPYLEKPYSDMAGLIQGASCRSVGLMLAGAQAEYPLWALLGAPAADLDIEWIVSGTPSAAFAVPGFTPCAIIEEADTAAPEAVNGLPLVYRYGAFRLYLLTQNRGSWSPSNHASATGLGAYD